MFSLWLVWSPFTQPYLQDRNQILYYACYTYMFKGLLLANFLLFSINLMKCAVSGVCNIKQVWGFLFKRRMAPVRPVQFFMSLLLFLVVVSALILGRDNSLDTIPLTALGSILVALFVSMIAFVGTAGSQEYHSIPGLLNSVRFGRKTDDEEIPSIVSREKYGHVLTVLTPLYDANGVCKCYIGADCSMEQLTRSRFHMTYHQESARRFPDRMTAERYIEKRLKGRFSVPGFSVYEIQQNGGEARA